MATRVKLKSTGMAQLLKGPVAEAACQPEAEKALARAEATAPVVSGGYRNSLHIIKVQHPTRVVFQVVADVDYAMQVESKTGNLARSL